MSLVLLLDRAFEEQGARARLLRLVRDGSLAALSALPWVLAYLVSTGSPVPATIAAKHNFFAEGCYPDARKIPIVRSNVADFVLTLGSTALGVLFLLTRRLGRALLLFPVVLIAAYYHSFPAALSHYEHRYLYALFPLALLGLAFGLAAADVRIRLLAMVVLAAAALQALIGLPRIGDRLEGHFRSHTRQLDELARFVEGAIPPDAPLLVHDIGFLSTTLPNPLIDLVGLKLERAALYHERATWPSCGALRVRVVEALALEEKTTYLVMLDEWERHFRIATGLRKAGWQLEPLRPGNVVYQVFRLTPPAGAVPWGDAAER